MSTRDTEKGGSPPSKRIKLVSSEDDKIELQGNVGPLTLDKRQKTQVILFLLDAYEQLHARFMGIDDRDHTDVNLSTSVMSVLYTCHTILRQQANGQGSVGKKVTEFTARYRGSSKTLSKVDALNIVTRAAEENGLVYSKPLKERNHWFGTCAPLIAFLSLHPSRRSELRTGHDTFEVGSTDGDILKVKTSDYGLDRSHHVLCSGLTYNPTRRSSMAQSLGPMVPPIMLVRSKKNDYADKWKMAMIRSGGQVPFVEEFANALTTSSANQAKLALCYYANVMLAITGRQAHRAAFPMCFLMRIINGNDPIPVRQTPDTPPSPQAGPSAEAGMEVDASGADEGQGTAPGLVAQVSEAEFEKRRRVRARKLAEIIDFSGKGMLWVANSAARYTYNFPRTQGMNPELAAQIVFHSVFDTYSEDLSILAQITDCTMWATRAEMGNTMHNMGSVEDVVTFKPISFTKFAKLKSASGTSYLATGSAQVIAAPVFAGKREVCYLEEFMEKLQKQGSSAMPSGRTMHSFENALQVLSQEIREKMEKEGKRSIVGSTPWFAIPSLGDDFFDEWSICNEHLASSNRFFLG